MFIVRWFNKGQIYVDDFWKQLCYSTEFARCELKIPYLISKYLLPRFTVPKEMFTRVIIDIVQIQIPIPKYLKIILNDKKV